MNVPFVKMSGAGNDFVLLDGRTDPVPPDWQDLIPALCDRRNGIGADGVLLITPAADADFGMDYFNSDGSTGSVCGNGGRCASARMMDLLGRERVTFRSCGRLYGASRSPGGVILDMDAPGRPRMNIPIRLATIEIIGHFVDTGSPHLVIVMEKGQPDGGTVLGLGRAVRNQAEFGPAGTNVDFISPEGGRALKIRTYERGVEDETRACGTGAVAAAVVSSLLHGWEGTISVGVTPLSGDRLTVHFRRTGDRFDEVKLEGPALVTFTGVYETVRNPRGTSLRS